MQGFMRLWERICKDLGKSIHKETLGEDLARIRKDL